MKEATLRVFRGETTGGKTVDYRVPLAPGMVVLDALHHSHGHLAPTWPCAGTVKQENAARARPK